MKKSKYELKSGKIIVRPTNESDLWSSPWDILLNDRDYNELPVIGYISFEGEKERGTIPISIEIFDKDNRNKGYGTEAIRLMTDWAFLHKNIFEITAVSEHENSGYIMALQKAGYVMREATREIEHYSIVREATTWTGLYLMIGIVVGLALGFVFGNGWVGLISGLLVCLAIGASMDLKEKTYRESVIGRKISGKSISGKRNSENNL